MEKFFDYNKEKNALLKQERNICFEEIIMAIHDDKLLDIIAHPNQQKYKGQKIYVIDIDGYVYLVPFVENTDSIFLKTIFPSRKLTKQYLAE